MYINLAILAGMASRVLSKIVARILPILSVRNISYSFLCCRYKPISLQFFIFSDEICLDQTEWPLGIALNATKPIRFILRINKDEKPVTNGSEVNETNATANTATNGKISDDVLLRPNGGNKRDRPLSGGVYDFMYAGRDKSIKMTAGAVYDKKAQNSPKPKKGQGSRPKGRSLGAVLKLPKKNRSLERGHELSTNHMVPGVLKVFGAGISADSNYKSVKVTNTSDADSIVKQALGKYKLDSADSNEFVLCDVVGHFRKVSDGSGKGKDSQMQWVTEYARVVSDQERPLVLQSLWQPTGNRSRRFELHRKGTVVDGPRGASPASNGVARKKATIASQPPDLTLLKKKLSISSQSECSESGTFESPQRSRLDDGSVSHSNLTFNMSTAVDVPYLLLLRGSGIAEDYLLHRLDEDHMIIGRPTIGQKHPDIPLYSDDLQTQHCQVFKKLPADNESVAESEDGLEQVFLEPFPSCEVMVNGRTLTDAMLLTPGDLLQIGLHYVFLYKDPIRTSDANLIFDWLPGAAVGGYANSHGRAKVIQMQQVARNPNRLSLGYELEDEDRLLEYFVTVCESAHDDEFELVASYLFILAVEYSALNHADIDTRRLILKVTNVIQAVAWVSCVTLFVLDRSYTVLNCSP
jgi:hypothetical protein